MAFIKNYFRNISKVVFGTILKNVSTTTMTIYKKNAYTTNKRKTNQYYYYRMTLCG